MKKAPIPIRALFDNIEELTSEDIKASNILLNLLKQEVPSAIEYAMANKKTFATIFEINASSNYLEIHKNYWEEALNTCMRLFINDGEENYEMCHRISKMIEALQLAKK